MKKYILLYFLCLISIFATATTYNLTINFKPSFAGYGSSSSCYEEGSRVQLSAYNNEGFKFKYWTEDGKIISSKNDFCYIMPSHDVQLIAVFEYAPDNPKDPQVMHRLILNASPSYGGYFNQQTISYAQENSDVVIWAYGKSGFKFKEWQENDITISKENPLTYNIGNKNHNIKAVFVYNPDAPDNPGKMYCNLKLSESTGGHIEGSADGLYEKGAYISLLAIPDNGYHFVRWSDGSTESSRYFYIDTNISLSAVFEPDTYTLKYIVDGEEYKTVSLEYGAEIVPEQEPAKEGYTFSGWSDVPKTMPAHDVTVTGTFSINHYTLKYIVDEEEYKTVSLEYGAEIVPEQEPAKEGYTFSGWSDVPKIMPAHDVTVTGTFSINIHKISWVIDDVLVAETEAEYGAYIIEPEIPIKEGYEFTGWDNVPKTMPDYDIIIKGHYKVISEITSPQIIRRNTDVYNIHGNLVRKNMNIETIKELKSGIYIIEGRTIVIDHKDVR